VIFNLNIQPERADRYLQELKEQGAIIEIKKVSQTRTNLQNRALHLFFDMAAKELNENGVTYHYFDLNGVDVETRWTKDLFKEMTWKPLQVAMFGTDSTAKLKRNEIDPIFEAINLMFANMGIQISFPNQFDFYLKFYEKTH
jgi:hypothetical protein